MQKRSAIILISILAVAFALRLIFLLTLKAKWPGFDTPTIDALYHHIWAQNIVGGNILGGGPYFRAPLYPYLLAAIYFIFGTNFTITFFIQILFGVATVALTYFLAKRLYDERVAIISALLVAINGVMIFFELQLLLDFLTPFFFLLILLFLLRWKSNPKTIYLLWAGIFCGLFALTRPNILALAPLFIGYIFFGKQPLNDKIKGIVYFIVALIIIIAPVTLRNILIGGDFVLIASQGGINFYIGNNEQADGKTALLPGKGHTWQYSDAEFEAAVALGKKPGTMKPSQVSDYYTKKAWQFIIGQPAAFLKLLVKKTYLFWNYYEISNNNSLYFITRHIGLSFIPLYLFAIIGPLGLVGAVLGTVKGGLPRILGLSIFAYFLTVIAFFVTDRFRLPVVPLLTICAAYLLFEIVDAARANDRLKFYSLVAGVIFVGLFCWSDFYGHHDTNEALAYYSLGNVYMKKKDYDRAADQFNKAIELAPCVPHAHTNLGVIAFYRGDTTLAREEFEREIKSCGASGKALNNLSLIKRLGGDFETAYLLADSAVASFPNFREAYINRISAAFGTENEKLIENAVKEFYDLFPDDIAARYYHGYYLETKGLSEQALADYRFAATSTGKDIVSEYDLSDIYSAAMPYGYDPKRVRAKSYFRLGVISASHGDYQEARDYFLNSLQLVPDDADTRVNLGLTYDMLGELGKAIEQFDLAIAADSLNPVYLYNFAMTLGKAKRYHEAESLLAKVIDLKPDFYDAKERLRLLRKYLHGEKS